MTLQSIIPAHSFNSLITIIQDLCERLLGRRKAKAANNKTLSEHSAMSSRELADIGIDRTEIPKIAAEAANMH